MSATGVHFWNAFLNTIRMIIAIVVVFFNSAYNHAHLWEGKFI